MAQKAIVGEKVGMTQVWGDDQRVIPVTVLRVEPARVVQVKTGERDGYSAVQLAFDEVSESKLTKAERGHLAKADAPAMRVLVEFRDAEIAIPAASGDDSAEAGEAGDSEAEAGDDQATAEDTGSGPKLGQKVTVDSFEEGEKVKVAGITVGKGFQGTVKRHGFGRGPVTHGSHNVRAPGSIGASAWPARVFKGMRLPGQMGNRRATQSGLEIARIDSDRNLMMIKGSVPGAKNSIVEIRSNG